MSKLYNSNINSTINFKSMNNEKFSQIEKIVDNLDLKFLSKTHIKISYPLETLIIQSPFLSIYSINKNKLLLDLSEDDNDIQFFINFIKKLEVKIDNLYQLKKKFYSFNTHNTQYCQNYLFNSNFIFESLDKYFLKLSLNSNKVQIDNSNQSFKISKVADLKKTYCNLFFEVTDIWEKDNQFGYHISVIKIDRNKSHLLPDYSFISSDSENESQDDILLFGDPIIDNSSNSENDS